MDGVMFHVVLSSTVSFFARYFGSISDWMLRRLVDWVVFRYGSIWLLIRPSNAAPEINGREKPFGTWNESGEYSELGKQPWLKVALVMSNTLSRGESTCTVPFGVENSLMPGSFLQSCLALRMRSSFSLKCSQMR